MTPSHDPASRTAGALYAIGHNLLEAARFADATKLFRVMLRMCPEDERAWLGLGLCHEELGDDDIAAEIYGAGCVVAVPRSARCYLALARLKRRCGDRELVEECLEECARLIEGGGHDDLEPVLRAELQS